MTATTSAPAGSEEQPGRERGPGHGQEQGGVDGEGDPRRWKALAVCLVIGFMTLLDISIVNVALPSIRQGAGAGQSALQWVVSGYALAFGLLLVPAGRLGDARDRRTIFVAGLVVFLVASAACGLSPSPGFLIAARLVQGLGGGVITPQIAGLIQELFRGPERGKAFGLLGSTIGLGTAVGPLLGGALIQAFGVQEGWRAVFFVNIPIGLVALPFALRFIPRTASTSSRERDYDPVGVVLLAVGVVLLLLPFVERDQLASGVRWLLGGAAVVVLGAFLLWERRYERKGKEPEVDLSLFRQRSYTFGTLVGLVYFAGFTGVFFILTLYLQQGLAYSALLAGVAVTPFALGSAVSSALGGRQVSRFGRPLVTIGLLLVLVGLGVTLIVAHLVQTRSVGWASAAPLLVAGIGSGLVISPNQALTLSDVPVQRSGSAAGVLQTGQRVGSAVGIALIGSVFFSAVASGGRNPAQQFGSGFRSALIVTLVFVGLALLIAVADLVSGRAGARRHLAPSRG